MSNHRVTAEKQSVIHLSVLCAHFFSNKHVVYEAKPKFIQVL